MSQAKRGERRRSPAGVLVLAAGTVSLAAVVGTTFHALYNGTRASFGTISAAEPTTIVLPSPGDYIIARSSGISNDRSLTLTVQAAAAGDSRNGQELPASDGRDRNAGASTDGNQILGYFTANAAGPVSITAQAAAYPLDVKRNPFSWLKSRLAFAGIWGTAAAALIAIGAYLAITEANRRQRQAQEAFYDAIGE
ncbi:MAG: hypothetical protein AAFR96_12825 [Planctomycetota bacterium]